MPRADRTAPRLLAAGLAFVALAPGCGYEPKTYPVKGKVVSKGGKPWSGGTVTFQSVDTPGLSATGDIQKDGTFTLRTHYVSDNKGRTKPGAVAGTHDVLLDPLGGQTDRASALIVPTRYRVSTGENDITVEAEEPGKP